MKEKWMKVWKEFEEKYPKLSKWVYQLFYFFVFSMGVTIFQYLVFTFMPHLLGKNLFAQCINFPLQRNITFKSKGNPVYQVVWYFLAWIIISLICNGFNNLWMPIAQQYVAPAIYNLLVTFITGGVSMVIFFFVFKIIFPEGEGE